MRNINRIDDFCAQLATEWKKVPDWRFMQLINNLIDWMGTDGFYIEDEELLARIKDFLKND